jgi:hypothetical protein
MFGVAYWALRPVHWVVNYRVLVCACGFYRDYKSRRWVWALPTRCFIVVIILPWCTRSHALALLLHLAFDDFSNFLKLMARYSPLSKFATASAAEVKDPNMVDDPVEMA